MATTFDLIQEDFAEIKLAEDATFKVRLLKRKDKAALIELEKKAQTDAKIQQADIVDIMAPYIMDEKGEQFKEVCDNLTFQQLRLLQKVWFDMNGMEMPTITSVPPTE